MCITVIFIVKENIQIIARFIFISTVVFTGFILSALFVLKDATFSFLLPVGAQGVMPIIEGVPETIYSYFGFAFLIVLHPFVRPANKGIVRAASIANIFVTCFYLLLVVVTIVSFTTQEMLIIPEPVLFLMKAISFRIIERPDLFFTSMWIALVATTIITSLYTSSLGFSTVFHKVSLKYWSYMIGSMMFLGSLPVNDMFIIHTLTTFSKKFLLPGLMVLPILFLIISLLFNKKETVKK